MNVILTERDDPDEEDHDASSRRRRLELERVADGPPALHADDAQSEDGDTHRDTLQQRERKRQGQRDKVRETWGERHQRSTLMMLRVSTQTLTETPCNREKETRSERQGQRDMGRETPTFHADDAQDEYADTRRN